MVFCFPAPRTTSHKPRTTTFSFISLPLPAFLETHDQLPTFPLFVLSRRNFRTRLASGLLQDCMEASRPLRPLLILWEPWDWERSLGLGFRLWVHVLLNPGDASGTAIICPPPASQAPGRCSSRSASPTTNEPTVTCHFVTSENFSNAALVDQRDQPPVIR